MVYEGFAGQGSELVVGSLLGYRGWKVTVSPSPSFTVSPPPSFMEVTLPSDFAYLKAVSFNVRWDTTMKARCRCSESPSTHVHASNTGMIVSVREHSVLTSTNTQVYTTRGGKVLFGKDALCPRDCTNHSAPYRYCSCGIYCWYLPEQLLKNDFLVDIIGVTENTGTTVLGSLGFRAQQSKILALAPPPGADSIGRQWYMRAIKATYPEVDVFASFNELIEAYPPDVDSLINLGIDVRDMAESLTRLTYTISELIPKVRQRIRTLLEKKQARTAL